MIHLRTLSLWSHLCECVDTFVEARRVSCTWGGSSEYPHHPPVAALRRTEKDEYSNLIWCRKQQQFIITVARTLCTKTVPSHSEQLTLMCVCVCVTVHIKMLAYHWLLSWLWYLVKEGEGCCELYLACWYQKKFKRTERHRLLSEHQCTIVTYRHKRLKLKQNFFLFYFYLKTEITINLIISESKTQVKLVDHLEKIIRMKRWNICRLKYFN